MRINEILDKTTRPDLYEKGTVFMWTDEHISKQLLEVHLNPELDLGSRKMTSIEKTADWILDTQKGKGKLNILDLGCGPGLYTALFARKGHQVTGVDISKHSIDYARKSAKEKGLDISYINESYLDISLEPNSFDLIIMIFTDMGVLSPTDRDIVLKMIYSVLKKGGTFIFDVLKDINLSAKMSPKSWETSGGGFWKPTAYLALSESFLYKEEKVILFQHNIIDAGENIETYRFWTHFFSQDDVSSMLKAHNFTDIEFREDILPEGDMWNGDNVIFTMTSK